MVAADAHVQVLNAVVSLQAVGLDFIPVAEFVERHALAGDGCVHLGPEVALFFHDVARWLLDFVFLQCA